MLKLILLFITTSLFGVSAMAQDNLQQQRDKDEVISYLEVFDLATRQHKIVHEFPYRIEAPNWTPDGRWFVYNSHGLLYKLDAQNPSSEPILIDTGSARGCNNDHVVSADGSFIGISDQWPSKIFVVPFEGGTPHEITPNGPSYLHGISPDGKEVAYCAFRGDDRAVYAMDIDGKTPERCLTAAPGLNDGPEYSHDGKHIWYCSTRTGLMQVWRMNRDGSKQKQMTFDKDVNSWFPHISPNGKWVTYICYHRNDLAADEHVPNKNVLLRLMSAKGGKPETIVELFGGQGTINVNSWSPDSKKFAYVSYKLK